MTRKKIAPAELHDILTREFRKSAGDLCMKCRIPMPAYLEPGPSGGPNWRIGGIAECSGLCHTFLEEVVGKLATQYDITGTGKRSE